MSVRNSKVKRKAALQAILDRPRFYFNGPFHFVTTKPAARLSKRRRATFGANKKSGKQKLPIVPRRRLGKPIESSSRFY